MKIYLSILTVVFFICNGILYADTMYCVESNTNPKLKWTAFKYTSKTGVSGTFKDIKSTIPKNKNSITNIIKNSIFSINISSVDSSNAVRDNTLRTKFFDLFKETKISGNVKSVSKENKTFVLLINMNGEEKLIKFNYNLSDDLTIKATGQIDILDFGLKNAHTSIHKACKTLHTGPDGVSKTWSEVLLEVSIKLSKNC